MKGLLQCKVLALGNAPIFLIKLEFSPVQTVQGLFVFSIVGLISNLGGIYTVQVQLFQKCAILSETKDRETLKSSAMQTI